MWLWWKLYALHCEDHWSSLFTVESSLDCYHHNEMKSMHTGQKGICSLLTKQISFMTVIPPKQRCQQHALCWGEQRKLVPFVCCQATSTLKQFSGTSACMCSSPLCLSLSHQSYDNGKHSRNGFLKRTVCPTFAETQLVQPDSPKYFKTD